MADDQSAAPGAGLSPAEAATDARRKQQRKQLFTIFGGVIVAALVLAALWWVLVASHYVETDDAYTGADVAQITPLVSGPVKAVDVADTQAVKAGQVLVQIDPADAQLAANRAEAMYEQAVRATNGGVETASSLNAQLAARAADLAHAQAEIDVVKSDVAKAKIDFDRRQALAGTGAVSGDELTAAKTAYENAQANLKAAEAAQAQAEAGHAAAQSQLAAQQAVVGGPVESNPEVAAARAARDSAYLDLQRTTIRAPVDGVVSRRQVQVGQRVQVGVPLMSIVPIDQMYVDANFKEGQLRKVRIGQPVTLTADLYGGGVTYHGTVVGIGGGTGSAFALIPAQNATGNWIKVVQRLPVRIRLQPDELKAHPLRLGLSMKAKIDVSQSGQPQTGG